MSSTGLYGLHAIAATLVRYQPRDRFPQVAADSDVIAGGTKVPARGSVVDRLPDKTCKA